MARMPALLLGFLLACRMTPDEPPKKTIAADKTTGVEFITAKSGDVPSLVRNARDAAHARNRKLLVYIGARWCEPCKRFHQAAEAGELDTKFPTLSLITFDLDDDADRLHAAGYAPGYIPYFGVPDTEGRATRNSTEGAVKGEGAVDHITPRLTELVAKAD